MRARDILDKKGTEVVTIGVSAKLDEAIKVLTDRNIGAVVVVEDDKPVGILSERDIVRCLAGAPTGFRETAITGLMTTELVTVTSEATIDEIKDLMTNRHIRHMPIVEEGRLVGILSIGDVVKHRIREARQEAEALRSYIGS